MEEEIFNPDISHGNINKVHLRQLMTIFQFKIDDGEDCGNMAIIDSISPNPLFLLFESDGLKKEILQSHFNPLNRAYFVDVVIMTANGIPTAYKIVGLHEKIRLPSKKSIGKLA